MTSRQLQRRMPIQMCMALDANVEHIKFLRALYDRPGYAWAKGASWKHVQPWWVIANLGDEPVGAVQILHGCPMGHIEHLAVVDGLRPFVEAKVKATIVNYACYLLKAGGADYAMGMVSVRDSAYKEALLKRGGVPLLRGDYVAMRL